MHMVIMCMQFYAAIPHDDDSNYDNGDDDSNDGSGSGSDTGNNSGSSDDNSVTAIDLIVAALLILGIIMILITALWYCCYGKNNKNCICDCILENRPFTHISYFEKY